MYGPQLTCSKGKGRSSEDCVMQAVKSLCQKLQQWVHQPDGRSAEALQWLSSFPAVVQGLVQVPCPALPCPALPCPALPCPALHLPLLLCPALHCIAVVLPCLARPCPVLHCNVQPCTALFRPTLPGFNAASCLSLTAALVGVCICLLSSCLLSSCLLSSCLLSSCLLSSWTCWCLYSCECLVLRLILCLSICLHVSTVDARMACISLITSRCCSHCSLMLSSNHVCMSYQTHCFSIQLVKCFFVMCMVAGIITMCSA